MRHTCGLTEDLPTGKQDKIIVLRNRHDLGLINGQFVTVDDVTHVDDITISATVKTEDAGTLSRPPDSISIPATSSIMSPWTRARPT